jgi:hypothetical protein
MGSLSVNDILQLKADLAKNFNEIIYLNSDNLKNLANGQINMFEGIAPEGPLKNTLIFYSQDNSILICFCHSILHRIFKNHVDTFIKNGIKALKYD